MQRLNEEVSTSVHTNQTQTTNSLLTLTDLNSGSGSSSISKSSAAELSEHSQLNKGLKCWTWWLMLNWVCLLQILAKKGWLSRSRWTTRKLSNFLENCDLFLQIENPEKLVLLRALERTPQGTKCCCWFFKATIFYSHTQTSKYENSSGWMLVFRKKQPR